MQADLQQSFDESETRRAALVRGVLTLTDEQAAWTPSDAAWSVRQIVFHLALSAEIVGRARPVDEVAQERGEFGIIPRSALRAMVLAALRRDVALPVPSDAMEPASDVGLRAALDRWDVASQAMWSGLEKLENKSERRYVHAVLGGLTAVQMLELEREHSAYHARQIEALKRHPAFP